MVQSMENNEEALLKWAKSMKSWQRMLVDSARFAAWHNVRTAQPRLTKPALLSLHCVLISQNDIWTHAQSDTVSLYL